ncbi:MAG: outer membrane lipoprotein carrier protein LolA, partial [Bacteroidales bacterium]|nr:outer membrane lipoprotein carrier protein LolA [Bacteroidales bacterium]
MEKIVFIIMSLCFTVAPMWAQQQNQGQLSSTKPHLDGGATQTLDKISTKYQSYSTVKIDYTCKTEKENKVIDSQKGSFAIKGDKYSFTDADNDYRCDGKIIWNYQKKIKEISIYNAEEDDDLLLNPIKTVINWKKNFRAKFVKEIEEKNIKLSVIDITPNTTQNYYKIRLYVDKNKN